MNTTKEDNLTQSNNDEEGWKLKPLAREDDCRCTANVKWNEVNIKTVTLQDPSGKAKVYDVVLINNKSETSYTNISKTNVEESFYVALGLQWLNVVLMLSLNTAVIITVLRYKKKSRLYFLLMNMAIADLSTGLIDASVNAVERTLGIDYLNYWWFGGDFLCRLQRTLSSTSLLASNFILAATSVDRALVVAKPMLNFKRGYTLQKILILACWLLSAAICSPLLKIYSQVHYDLRYMEGVQSVPLCVEQIETSDWKIYFYLLLIFYVLIPLTIIVISYTILILAIYKRARTPPNSVRGVDNLKIRLVFNTALSSSKARSIKLSFGIVLSFIAAWTPFFVILYMSIFKDFNNPVVMVFIPTYYWNCSVNPIIFFVFHKRRDTGTPSSVYSSDTPMHRLTNAGCSARSTPVRTFKDTESTPLKQNSNTHTC